MEHLRLDYSRLSIYGFIGKSQHIVNSISANPTIYVTPNPPLADVQTLIDTTSAAAAAAEDGSHTKIEIRNNYRELLANTITILGTWVENVCNGDIQKLILSGYDLAKTPSPIGPIPAPTGLVAEMTGTSGKVILKWKSRYGAKSYIIEATTGNVNDPATVWERIGFSTRARFTAEGLTPATFYSFRVIAIGAAGLSDPSEVATTIVG